jgi:hypothetical protein|tara:strand:- start:96 stop:485 length:390 start_codon:yes stop_codon:yes gene_type:complete
MDKTKVELYIGAWIDNSHGVYTQDSISEKMRQIALQFGVPKNKLPTMGATFLPMKDFSYELSFYEYHDELQRELEDLLNEYCTTDRPRWAIMDNGWKLKISEALSTCWAWHDNAFGLWYTSTINEEELA